MSLLLQSSLNDSEKWIILGLALVMIAYLALRPFMKKKDPLERAPSADRLARQRSVEQEMNGLLVQFAQMARELTAQLDTRAAKLELLIKEADQRIAELGAANEEKKAGGDKLSGTTAPVRAADEADARHLQIYALSDQGCSVSEIAQRLNRPSGEVELILALRSKA